MLKNQTVAVGKTLSYLLPQTYDPDKELVSINCNLGLMFRIGSFLKDRFTFAPKNSKLLGTYLINITLSDTNPKKKLYSFYQFSLTIIDVSTKTMIPFAITKEQAK